jgi:hypothetical protein
MFSNNNKELLKLSDDGSYFIDRDGSLFQWILNVYRNNQTLYPSDPVNIFLFIYYYSFYVYLKCVGCCDVFEKFENWKI